MRRWLPIALAVVFLVGLFLVLRPGAEPGPGDTGTSSPTADPADMPQPTSSDETSEPTSTPTLDAVEIEVEEGRVEGPDQLSVATGDRVAIEVESDVADHVHIHGYDIFRDIPAEEGVTITFRATIPGLFEIELEETGILLTRLEVTA